MAVDTVETSGTKNLYLLNTDNSGTPYTIETTTITSNIPQSGSISVVGETPLLIRSDSISIGADPAAINVGSSPPLTLLDFTNASPVLTSFLRVREYINLFVTLPIKAGPFNISDSVYADVFGTLKASDIIRTRTNAFATKTHNFSITDKVKLRDILATILMQYVVSSIDINDDIYVRYININSIVDSVLISDLSHESYILNSVIKEVIYAIDISSYISVFITSANFSINDVVDKYVSIVTKAIDVLSIDNSSSYNVVISFTADSDIVMTDNVYTSAQLLEFITDSILTFGTLDLDSTGNGGDENYTFVINTITKGISEYTNYNFSSMSNGLATMDDGIYELDGYDDDGEQILSQIKTGLMDFDSNVEKQVPYAYIGLSKNGSLMLKTIVTRKGNKKERWYKVSARNVDSTDTVRVNMSKGIKSRYWQFELENMEGEYFEIDSIELLPVTLKRRI